jgi:hypothetical protein
MLVLCCSTALAKEKTRLTVVVLQNTPTTSSYMWQVPGRGSVSCYSAGCSSYYMPSQSGTASVQGSVLRLLLPDSRIVIAACIAKSDIAVNLIGAFGAAATGGIAPSAVYRDCRTPELDATIEAEFNRSFVKLFWQQPSINDSGRISSETYRIKGVLLPLPSSQVASSQSAQSLPSPEFRSPYKAAHSVISPLPASSSAESTVDHVPTQQELTQVEKHGQASKCLFLITPGDAEIDIDGKKAGKSPLLLMLAENGSVPHAITIKKEGYFTVQRSLTPDGDDMRISVDLQRDWSH